MIRVSQLGQLGCKRLNLLLQLVLAENPVGADNNTADQGAAQNNQNKRNADLVEAEINLYRIDINNSEHSCNQCKDKPQNKRPLKFHIIVTPHRRV
ncbi:hypothetical protein D3C80_1929320 [compost metagenome]